MCVEHLSLPFAWTLSSRGGVICIGLCRNLTRDSFADGCKYFTRLRADVYAPFNGIDMDEIANGRHMAPLPPACGGWR